MMYAAGLGIRMSRIVKTGSRTFVDMHCHCLPALDDGPRSRHQAIALCRGLVRDHIGIVVATPHQLGRFGRSTNADVVRGAVRQLSQELLDQGIDVMVSSGAEIRLDERIDALLAMDEILTIADMHRHILLELPAETFIDIEPLIVQLACRGVGIVIAHPERNLPLFDHRHILSRWLDHGVSLQVTAGSLMGFFGARARAIAWRLVAEGWASVVATDAHDCRLDDLCLTVAFEMIAAKLGGTVADRLCIENPFRLVKGRDPVPIFARDMQDVG